MKNKLAYIGKITEIKPIRKADFIVSAKVVCGEGGKWMGTVQKDQFKVDELVEVYLQDAIVPDIPDFEFMRPHKFRVSMRKFKKVPSECLIMPMHLNMTKYGLPGTDISSIRNVEKYVKVLPANLAGITLGSFPTVIVPKTDEPNFQTTDYMIEQLQGQPYYSIVKCDGSSGTIYKDYSGVHGHLGCCSRNLEFKPSETTAIWKIANDYDLEMRLPVGFAIQLEMCGPGIQKNRLALDKIEPRVFNVWDIKEREYLDAVDMFAFCNELNIPTVEVIVWNGIFDIKDDDILRSMAEGKYSSNKQREGIVIRPMKEQFCEGERLSFKVLNLLFKD